MTKREVDQIAESGDGGETVMINLTREAFDRLVATARDGAVEPKTLARFDVGNLGELTQALECYVREGDANKDCYFDVLLLVPTSFASYRGIYSDLALGYAAEGKRTVAALFADARRMMNAFLTGWKGGEYRMTAKTKVWVANPGETGDDRRVVGVRDAGWCVIIETKAERDE